MDPKNILRDFLARLTSRKFLLALAGIIGNVLLAASGSLDWPMAMDNIKNIILGYLLIEGAGDALGKYSYYKNNK